MNDWMVTYFNPMDNHRHCLIDCLDEQTADAVVERFGDNGDEFNRMPEVRKELMASKFRVQA